MYAGCLRASRSRARRGRRIDTRMMAAFTRLAASAARDDPSTDDAGPRRWRAAASARRRGRLRGIPPRRASRAWRAARRGAAICSMRPSFITATASPSSSASSWSWVTNTVVSPSRSCRPRSQPRQFLAHLGVERAERLVEQEHARLDGQRPGERDALALAAGKLARITAAEASSWTSESSSSTRRLISAREGAAAARPHFQAEGDVLGDRHVLEERILLEDEAGAALARGQGQPVEPGEGDMAEIGIVEAAQDAQQRGSCPNRRGRAGRGSCRRALPG